MELVKIVYLLTADFPKNEVFGLTSQMKRAVISVPSNIAEGFSRKSKKEFSQFTSISFGSGAELETQLILAESLGFIKDKNLCQKANGLLNEIMRMLNKLNGSLNANR